MHYFGSKCPKCHCEDDIFKLENPIYIKNRGAHFTFNISSSQDLGSMFGNSEATKS